MLMRRVLRRQLALAQVRMEHLQVAALMVVLVVIQTMKLMEAVSMAPLLIQ